MAKGKKDANPQKPHKKQRATRVRTAASSVRPTAIVAIGASAGGLEPIMTLLSNLPTVTGAAYVVIQHLPAKQDELLPQLLQARIQMKVRTAEDKMRLEPDIVYVINGDAFPAISDGHFALSPRGGTQALPHVIDNFFSTLARVYQSKAIAVVLSGTGSDGTAGVQAVKAEGGITFAQDYTAQFQGMPHSAIESGFVDFILSPERIAREIQNILTGPYTGEVTAESIAGRADHLRRIHQLLLRKHDVDFSQYKQTTIIRRIIRRMSLNRLNTLDQYVKLLVGDPGELDQLHRDLLINVTSFFREPDLYAALSQKLFPDLLKDDKRSEPIRIWIPACATGEEPYSIAICFFEYLKDKAINTPIQIFATDLSEKAITKARAGIYSGGSLANISPERLRKFFIKMDGNFQIIKSIRDICIFATHNLLKDPPFSRMDLISCQNVLIYMEPSAQKKIIEAFNYALKPSRFLVLGKSETIGANTDLFEQIDKDLRIYMRKTAPNHTHFDFYVHNKGAANNGKEEKMPVTHLEREIDVEKEAERLMLSQYMPASILVNKDLQILRFYGAAFPYLKPASGKASLNLLKLIRDELIFELRTLIKQVKKENKSVRKDRVTLVDHGQASELSIEVHPIRSTPEPHMLLVLQPAAAKTVPADAKPMAKYKNKEKEQRIIALDQEIREAREHVKSITEDFEAAREELQSANEEVLSSNEELQSINEELETSKEELQSTNEELITINEELQLRNNELKEAFDYSRAIIEIIREPLMVLNTDLRVLTINHAFATIFRLDPEDVEGDYLYEVGGRMFDLPLLLEQLRKMTIKQRWLQDFELEHVFIGLGNKKLLLNAVRISAEGGRKTRILLAIEDITAKVHKPVSKA